MDDWKIIVVALDGRIERAAEWRRHLTRFADESQSRGTVHECSTSALDAIDFASADAILMLDGHSDAAGATAVMDIAENAGVPVVALVDATNRLREDLQFAGALVLDASADPVRVWSALQGVLHRQDEINRLKSEAALTQRFQGGLKGEIARMHEELQLAALVQREFLPRETPIVHGVEFACMWRPTNYVSGDIYDVIQLDEDRVGIFIADAVGHGVPAALMTMVISRSLTTRDIDDAGVHVLPPSDVMKRLNTEMIRRQGRSTRFATAVYAVIDCRSRTLRLAGAGHPPPLLLRRDGTTFPLETSGGLLGVFDDENYDEVEVELEFDDRLLFYTDGFEQAFGTMTERHNRRLPTTQYRREFDRLRDWPSAAAMVDTINQRIDDQAGSLHQVDDLTLICVHVGAVAAHEEFSALPGAQSARTGVALRLVS